MFVGEQRGRGATATPSNPEEGRRRQSGVRGRVGPWPMVVAGGIGKGGGLLGGGGASNGSEGMTRQSGYVLRVRLKGYWTRLEVYWTVFWFVWLIKDCN